MESILYPDIAALSCILYDILTKLSIMNRDYLANRKQRVVLNGENSPLFVLVCVNDLVNNIECDVRIFADDTSLFLQ